MKTLKIGGLCLLFVLLGSTLFAIDISLSYGVNGINLIHGNTSVETFKYMGSGLDFTALLGRRMGFYTNLFLSFLPPFSVEDNGTRLDPNQFVFPLTAEVTLGLGGRGQIFDNAGIIFGFGFHSMIVDLMSSQGYNENCIFSWTWGFGGSAIFFFNLSKSMTINIGAHGSYDLVGYCAGDYEYEYDPYYDDYYYSSSSDFARSLNWNITGGIGFHF
jgi:hypothetical protein